ncbi:hypothetical protein J4456_01025 [Candidatus Pacearchaeota archaeon]|nr:hypothetical protein [Candidatus Pacearchaeota archaeon]
MDRKGQGHVEMIISFVLFVGFLLFIFLYLNPFYESTQKISINRESDMLLKRLSEPVGKLSVIVETSEDCYDLKEFNKIYGDNFIEIKEISNPGKPLRYTIYYGNFFNPGMVGVISCSGKLGKAYSLGAYTQKEVIVRKKITDLKAAYEADYSSLILDIGIGHFTFSVRDFDGNFVNELSVSGDKISENTEVFSRDIPISVMDDKGVMYDYIFNIRMWK